MKELTRIARSRDKWKAKATARAKENRYLRRQLRILRARARARTATNGRQPVSPRNGLARSVGSASVPVDAPLSVVPRTSPLPSVRPVSDRAAAEAAPGPTATGTGREPEAAGSTNAGKQTGDPPASKSKSAIASLVDAYAVRILSVMLVLRAVVSFRSVPRILRLTHPGSWCPHFTSVINWTLRYGLSKLQGVASSQEPWIAIIDASINAGLSKVMVVLRVPLDALTRRGSCPAGEGARAAENVNRRHAKIM